MFTDRRCSTTEVAGLLKGGGSNGRIDATQPRGKPRQPIKEGTDRGTTSDPPDDVQPLREAIDCGWVRREKTPSDSLTEQMSTCSASAVKNMGVEDALGKMLDELLSLKENVACLQLAMSKSTEETMALRKLVSRPTAHALSW